MARDYQKDKSVIQLAVVCCRNANVINVTKFANANNEALLGVIRIQDFFVERDFIQIPQFYLLP